MLRLVRAAAGVALAAVLVGCATTKPPPDESGLPAAGARRTEFFRAPGPRASQTVFSALDLPTPNSVRTASGLPGPDYWQQQVDYKIDATLDAEKKAIEAHAVITYINNSPEDLPYLWLHLEQNLFKEDSLGSQSLEPGSRFGYHGAKGGYEIASVRSVASQSEGGGKDLKLSVYDTVGRLDLPVPVKAKGGKFTFEIAYRFNIPPYGVDRMGIDECAQGDVFEIAQWFPAACVYDDVHGWNTLPYLGQGEFYTNYGDYDVRLTVPRDHIVASTGELQNADEVLTKEQRERLAKARESEKAVVIVAAEEVGKKESRPEGSGPLTWQFKAHQTRTFAWASSKAFIWDGCFLAQSGPEGEDGKLKGTLCMSVYPKEAMPLWGQKSTDDLRFSIDHYSQMWHRYPYPVATNVGGGGAPMEYPMIIFCGGRGDEHGLFGVTTHEIGHNWFPMLVNTDERRHAWMDEGFNSFVNIYAGRARYPSEAEPRHARGNARDFTDSMREGQQQPMDTIADYIWRGRLGGLEYAKTATAMVLLREVVLGPDRFDPAFRRYIDAWAFKSPQPADFFRCMEDGSGMDLAWFWRGWFLETGKLDQAITDVGMSKDGKSILVTLTNKGELVMPVEAWATTNQWTTMWDANGRTVKSVELDPDAVLPDVDLSNNRWPPRGK